MAKEFSRFSGTDSYITSPELRHAVNVAAAIERPLLVLAEPRRCVIHRPLAELRPVVLLNGGLKLG